MGHGPGIDDFTVDVAERLAGAGFVAAAPDVYHRREGWENLVDGELLADIAATVEHFEDMPEVDPDRIGVIGHCMGGRNALLGAAENPALRAAAIYYGGNLWVSWGHQGPPHFAWLPGLHGPVLGFFGLEDTNPSPEDVDRLDDALSNLGVSHEFYRYPGAGHAFQRFSDAERFLEAPARDAWEKTLAFLRD